nr:MAG TPA: DNA binding protein [Caudoviricetes sp.]
MRINPIFVVSKGNNNNLKIMKDRAEVVRLKTFGMIAYQVNIVNPETGLYRSSTSRRFETKKEALEFISEYGLTI